MNETYLPYGVKGTIGSSRQRTEDVNAYQNKRSYIARSISKSSSYYSNTSWDLVDASDESNFDISQLDDSDLPERMKGKSEDEKMKIIAEFKQRRKGIKADIQELKRKRDAFLAQNKKEDSNALTLGDAIIKALKEQALRRQFIL